jgi:hypothetical protein
LTIKEVIEEYKGIRGKYTGKPSPTQRKDIEAANDFFNTVADQINTKAFTEAKVKYREFKQNQQMIHEAIDLYAPEMKTAKGERFLSEGGLRATSQGRKTAEMITEKTGESLEGAKWWSRRKSVNPLYLLRR